MVALANDFAVEGPTDAGLPVRRPYCQQLAPDDGRRQKGLWGQVSFASSLRVSACLDWNLVIRMSWSRTTIGRTSGTCSRRQGGSGAELNFF